MRVKRQFARNVKTNVESFVNYQPNSYLLHYQIIKNNNFKIRTESAFSEIELKVLIPTESEQKYLNKNTVRYQFCTSLISLDGLELSRPVLVSKVS